MKQLCTNYYQSPLPYQRLGYSLGPADRQGADVWEKITDCPPMPSRSIICALTVHALRIEPHVAGEQSDVLHIISHVV